MGVPIENIQVGNETHPISASTLNTPASIDGVAFDGGESITHYTVCSTAAGTAEKTVSVGGEYTRDSGSAVRVKFTYANTASNPTLDVNNTGAAPISVYGDQNADSATWQAGETLDLVFDGTRWQIVGGGIASTTIRGRVKLDATPTSGSNNAPSSGGVYAQLALKAPLASPALTGTPTAPTAPAGTSSTQIATTAYVDAAEAVTTDKLYLLADEVPDTVQTYTFVDGSVSQVLHTRNNDAIRTDVFAYTATAITETRTLNTGAVLTIVTDLDTLETTVSYTAA